MKTTVRESGVALVTTVIILAVMAVVAVALMQGVTSDRYSARSVANYTRAKLAAEAGAAMSQAMLTDLIGRYPDSVTVWQNIGGGTVAGTNNEATVLYVRAQSANTNDGASPAAFGSSVVFLAQPLVSRTNTSPNALSNVITVNTNLLPISNAVTSVPLVSSISVNLNATNSSRPDPFVGSRSATNSGAPVTAAQWIYMTRDGGPTNSTNPYVARYAFWMEDESFKVNVNTATNGPRGSTSLGLSPAEIRLDGVTNSSSNAAIRNINVGNVIAARGSLSGSFPTAATAALAGGLTNAQASPEFRFLTTTHSRSLNFSRAGFKRFDINTLTNGLPGAARANMDRFIAAITNSNSIPNFGQRFYRLATNSSGINNTSAVTAAHADIYLQKIAANLLDYLDSDDQPTVINNDGSFTLRTGRPTNAITATGNNTDGSNSVAAMGIENLPRLQEYAMHVRLRSMRHDPANENSFGFNSTNDVPNPASAEYEIWIDHYFEFWNPGTRDITLTDAFLQIDKIPAFPNAGGVLAGERSITNIPVNATFPAGQVTVLTTAPLLEANSSLLGSQVVYLAVPDAGRKFTGVTTAITNLTYSNYNRLFFVSMEPGPKTRGSVFMGNNSGLLESFVGLTVNALADVNASGMTLCVSNDTTRSSLTSLATGNTINARGGSLRGNSSNSIAGAPFSTEGDPRALNEQLEFRNFTATTDFDQTRFFVTITNGPSDPDNTLGQPNSNFVKATNWVDHSSLSGGANNAPLFIRNGAALSIAELGHVTDPARVSGVSGALTNVAFSRGGGRTLRIGQPEVSRWYDGIQTNASRTWTSWRLADVFTVTNALVITGAVNPNGILRDGGAALRAALFDFRFQPSPDGASATANRSINTNNFINSIISRMTNVTAAGLPANSVNVFWERGELSELPLFNSGNTLAAGVLMSNAFDRGREEVVRRSIEMITTRGSVFTVYAIGQALQVTTTSTNVLSSARVKTTFELIPQFAKPDEALDDTFSPANATNRLVAPSNYTYRVLQSSYD